MAQNDIENLPELPAPMEILDLGDGESIELEILSWELGKGTITPTIGFGPKVIKILRVHVAPGAKVHVPNYWDITSTTLQAGLLPDLEGKRFSGKIYKITKHGVAPQARFALEVRVK